MTPELLRVAGRYEIHRLLGRGGMASVHLARQPALDREVALKELHSAHVKDAAFAHRFLNESRVAGALNHPSVVCVIEYFEHEGVPFIAMEYLERGSLRPLVGQLTLAQVAGVLDSVLGGLAEAAAQGIVHRDLKPENVLVTADGHAKVADFGIAKAIGQVCMTDFRTATGQIVGTPAYMAPEQISGGEITPQVDLYATGLVAYELLAGRHPFHGTDAPMALLMHHVNDEPPPLASVRPDLPPGVVAWVHAMLAKDPAARPAGAAAAWDRLEGVVSDALGPRWRRDATITEPAVDPAARGRARAPSERSGIYSVVLPPAARAGPAAGAAAPAAPVQSEPARAHPRCTPTPCRPSPLPVPPAPRRRPRRRTLVLALAGALLVAIAAILYSTAPGKEPRAAPRPPAGPSLEQRVRAAVAPALAANAKLSRELSSLVARGRRPATRATAAARRSPRPTTPAPPWTGCARRTAAERLLRARAQRALSTQSDYLEPSRPRCGCGPTTGSSTALASARLVSRLERIETAVPRASESVGGARRSALARAELAAAQPPPAPVADRTHRPAGAAGVPPAPTATATPAPTAAPVPTAEPTPAPTVSIDEQRARSRHRRRARLRQHLQRLLAGSARRERLHEVAQRLRGVAAQDGPVPEARVGRLERRELALRPPVLRRVDREQSRRLAQAGDRGQQVHVEEDVAADQRAVRLAPERDVAGGVAGRVEDGEPGGERVALGQGARDGRALEPRRWRRRARSGAAAGTPERGRRGRTRPPRGPARRTRRARRSGRPARLIAPAWSPCAWVSAIAEISRPSSIPAILSADCGMPVSTSTSPIR